MTLLLAAQHECWVDGYVAEEARRNIRVKAPDSVAKIDRQIARGCGDSLTPFIV